MAIFKKFNKTENRDIYWIGYYDENGIRRRKSTGSSSHSFAKEYLNRKLDEVAHRKKLPDRYMPQIKFSEFIDSDYIPIHAKGSKYEANIKGICGKLKEYFGNKHLHDITSRDVEIYKKKLLEDKFEDNTINNRLNTLSGIFTKALEWGKALTNPVHKVKRFRIKERKRILDQREQELLISACGQEKKAPHLQAMVIFDLYTGLRKEELLSLKRSDVDLENKQIHVRG